MDDKLTKEIAYLIAQDKKNEEIAHEMNYSLAMLNKRLRGLFYKYEVRSRAGFIAKYFKIV